MDDQARHREELLARIGEYEACEGFRIMYEVRAFRTSYDIFIGNYGELKRALETVQDPQVWPQLWDARRRERLLRFNKEVARLLHNYVAAVKSLVEHTRNAIREEYAETRFLEEYEDRVTQNFANDPLIQFVQDLRNYMLHKSLHAASLTLEFGEGMRDARSYVVLNANKLREWRRWTPGARTYLDSLDDRQSLEEVIEAYKDKVMDFWKWMMPRLSEEHMEAFIEMARFEDRIREVDSNWESGYGVTMSLKDKRPNS